VPGRAEHGPVELYAPGCGWLPFAVPGSAPPRYPQKGAPSGSGSEASNQGDKTTDGFSRSTRRTVTRREFIGTTRPGYFADRAEILRFTRLAGSHDEARRVLGARRCCPRAGAPRARGSFAGARGAPPATAKSVRRSVITNAPRAGTRNRERERWPRQGGRWLTMGFVACGLVPVLSAVTACGLVLRNLLVLLLPSWAAPCACLHLGGIG